MAWRSETGAQRPTHARVLRAVDVGTERERNLPAADDTYPSPHDLNRPWVSPPSGKPYAVKSNPGAETLVEKWRDLVAARDALVARIEAGAPGATRIDGLRSAACELRAPT